ncbi:MAG TPA: hypothetical protein VMZ27_04465 [Candidatus Saccharimonadales bacterium]|nr:hypothetical protein [Candidatus Saccharimonadales bacterium]
MNLKSIAFIAGLTVVLFTPQAPVAAGDPENPVERRKGGGQRGPNEQRRGENGRGQQGQPARDPSQPAPARTYPQTQPDTTRRPPAGQTDPATARPSNPQSATTAPQQRPNVFTAPTARPPLTETKKPGGITEARTPSGAVRQVTTQDRKTGAAVTREMGPTGTVRRETVQKKNGTQETTQYDYGRAKKVEVVHSDRTKEVTEVQYNRRGEERARETVKLDARGTPVSKTVVVRDNLVVRNRTTVINNVTIVNNRTVVREYRPCRYGYIYRPVYFAPPIFTWWYDPFWYPPPFGGPTVVIASHHGCRFSWGWNSDPWYVYHRTYWEPYPVYVRPSYWVTDWMVAGYLADRYATAASVEQCREEVRLAREEAERARALAQQAKDQAEIAEARAAAATAEARAERAEARAEKLAAAEAKRKELELAGKPNPNATPIDKDTKEHLKNQIEREIEWKKANGELAQKGKVPLPEITDSLQDQKRIYPVSRTISVISKDDKPAGTLTAGDMLKAEPGQSIGKDAKETDFVLMRVMTSKGEDDEVTAGSVVKMSLKDLQEFDNEFRAKLDLGLQEADKNKDQFKELATK